MMRAETVFLSVNKNFLTGRSKVAMNENTDMFLVLVRNRQGGWV